MTADTLMQTGDMAYVRAQAEKAMPTTVHILERRSQEDGQGGYTEGYAIAYRDVPARLAEMGGRERLEAERQNVDADYVLTVPYDQNLVESMRVQHGEAQYTVAFVNAGRSYDTARRAMVKRL